jgi:hypothetical protein
METPYTPRPQRDDDLVIDYTRPDPGPGLHREPERSPIPSWIRGAAGGGFDMTGWQRQRARMSREDGADQTTWDQLNAEHEEARRSGPKKVDFSTPMPGGYADPNRDTSRPRVNWLGQSIPREKHGLR